MMRLGPAHKGDWWRVAEIIEWVARYTKYFPRFGRGHESGGDDGGMRFKHFDWPFIFISFGLAGGPYVCFTVFAAADDILGIITE